MVKDEILDAEARGMLLTLLSLPDDWNYSIKNRQKIMPCGYTKISNCLNKLEDAGYLRRFRVFEHGRVVRWEYQFAPDPIFRKEKFDV